MWEKEQKRSLLEIVVTAVLLLVCGALSVWVLPEAEGRVDWIRLGVFLVPYLFIGWRVLAEAGENLIHGELLDEEFLMAAATVGALCIGEYPEAVFVMLFFRVGELFEDVAVGRSRASIRALLAIRPDTAHAERDGGVVDVPPEEVSVGDVIVIRPGERVPLDGEVLEGSTTLDTSPLTGEPMPRAASAGDAVISGCVNLSGLVRVRVTKAFGESTVSRILALAEDAGERKSRSERFITRFARIYTPAVVGAAVLLAVLPPLIVNPSSGAVWSAWIARALSFLVISCPCALVISVPLAFFGGLGGASRRGILMKGSGCLEALASCDTLVFDKTGTMTEGTFTVSSISPAEGFTKEELLRLAAGAEAYSSHPAARALTEANAVPLTPEELHPASVRETAGQGVCADVGIPARHVMCGNARLLSAEGIACPTADEEGTTIHVAVDGAYAGCIVISDRLRPDAAEALAGLRAAGVKRLVMLTGDNETSASRTAALLGADEYRAGLLPDGKVAAVEAILTEKAASRRAGRLMFVGDGINDAPVLARADVGVAMGGMGSDAAIEAADVVLMNDRPSDLVRAVRASRRTLRIARENIVFALSVKAVVLILSALGLVGMWAAVFADVGVTVLAVLNAVRAMK